MQTTAIEAHERLVREAEANAKTEVRRIETMEVGKVCRQGDIYLHRVKASHPRGKAAPSNQLAIGETQGSRHVAEGRAEVFIGTTLPEWCTPGTFLGPVIVAKERLLVSHPEHAHCDLPPGTYQVTHQTDAKTRDRVAD